MSDLDMDMWDREYPATDVEEIDYQTTNSVYKNEENDDEYDIEETIDDSSDDLYGEQSLINNARIRLEQGRLYEMLIKHDLFDGVDASPEAVNKVQKEIKEFIMERLEVLLGMKAEKEKQVQSVAVELPFNEMEIKALKMVASKITNGASEKMPASEKKENQLNAVKKNSPTLKVNALGNKQQINAQPKKIKEKNITKPERKEMKEIGTKNMSIDEVAKRDIKYIESLKNMPLSEANKIVSERHNKPRSKKPINQDVVNAQYRAKMATNDTANTFAALLSMAKKK